MLHGGAWDIEHGVSYVLEEQPLDFRPALPCRTVPYLTSPGQWPLRVSDSDFVSGGTVTARTALRAACASGAGVHALAHKS